MIMLVNYVEEEFEISTKSYHTNRQKNLFFYYFEEKTSARLHTI